MFGFPVNLQDSGVQKMAYDADNGFPKIQRREIFYSVKNGSWFDLNVWQTASGNVGKLPGPNDDVFVRHSVTFGTQINYYVRNVYVTGNLSLPQYSGLYVNNYKAPGTTTFDSGSNLLIYGQDNLINNIVGDSYIWYAGNVDQEILNLDYYKLYTAGTGIKYLTKNLYLTKAGGIENQGILDLKGYELFVTGPFLYGTLYQGGSGKITFNGFCNVYATSFQLYGNPNVEFRNGLSITGPGSPMNTGTGTWSFTTNNQTITILYFNAIFNCKIIYDNIILYYGNNTDTSLTYFNDTINGTSPTSQFISRAEIGFNTIATLSSFTLGTYDLLTSNRSITNFSGNYSTTIPANLIGYNLKIEGTGTKTLPSNQSIQGTLNLNGGNLEVSTFNLTISGTTTLSGLLSKNGSGNIIFGGLVSSFGTFNCVDFSLGNPNVEFKNGINFAYKNSLNVKSGTGVWSFTTNNQSIGGPTNYYLNCQILIASGITLTIPQADATEVWLYNSAGINGQSATSTLINGSVIDFQVANCTLMTTGIFNPIGNLNSTIRYNSATTENLHFANYPKLTIAGGIKNAIGNTTINSTLRMNGGGQLALTTFDLSVLGQTIFAEYSFPTGNGYITKTSFGNVLFVGSLVMSNTWKGIAFQTGNPNVELRNGIISSSFAGASQPAYQTINSGTGIWSFTTNNQSIGTNNYSLSALDFDCEILISGAITLSINATATFNITFNKLINGNNASSQITFSANNVVTYKAATQPMATGILDTFTNLNTWIYGNANQDIKGGPTTGAKQVYRNLTLNGGGTKTLQGYVSVQNTYTLTSPATLNNNGFTLTNP